MTEIIHSWSSFVLRDLWGQPVQLLQFTNEKAETRELRWLAVPAVAPLVKAGPGNLLFWFQGSFYLASLIFLLQVSWANLLSLPASPVRSDGGRRSVVYSLLIPQVLVSQKPPTQASWLCWSWNHTPRPFSPRSAGLPPPCSSSLLSHSLLLVVSPDSSSLW